MPPRLTRSRLSNGASSHNSNGVTRRKSQRANKATNKPIEVVLDDTSDTDSAESDITPVSAGSAVLSNGIKHRNNNKRQKEIEGEDEEQADEEERENGVEESTNEEEDDKEHYEVENIVGKQFDRDGSIFYLVKWKNWNGEPTWEPEEHCLSCYNLVKKYEDSLSDSHKNKVGQLDNLIKEVLKKGKKVPKKQNRKQKRNLPTGSVAKRPVKLQFARIKRNRRSNN